MTTPDDDDAKKAAIENAREVPKPPPEDPAEESAEDAGESQMMGERIVPDADAAERTGDVVFSAELARILAAARLTGPVPRGLAALIKRCAGHGLTDVGNMHRLNTYFGTDFVVRAEDEMEGGTVLVWQSTHWSARLGAAALAMCSYAVGGMIRREAATIKPSTRDRADVAAGEAAVAELPTIEGESRAARERRSLLKALIRTAKQAAARLAAEVGRFAVWAERSENRGHLEAMREAVLPQWRHAAADFNADPLMVATLTHTLRFVRVVDLECPDPDVKRIADVQVEATRGHRREDYLTAALPVAYNLRAQCPKFDAFMATYQPDPETRRCIMQFAGVSMTALLIQRFALHWGRGANGKSVFLELLSRILGQYAVTLPNETILGPPRNAGQATPDIMQLFGRRMVRMVELESHQTLNVSMVKRLTGGEAVSGRPLYGGYVDFLPACKMHLTTNGEPLIEDVSNAIWRRLLLFEWPVKIPEAEQREFEEVVGELFAEREGILLRLIEGLKDYLINGFVVSDTMRQQIENYRGNMDWAENFIRECLERQEETEDVMMISADEAYAVYVEWAFTGGHTPTTQTAFGRRMGEKFKRERLINTYYYVGVTRLPSAPPADAMRVDEYRRRKKK